MELIGSLFLVLAVAFLVGLFISRPFFSRRQAAVAGADQVDTNEEERRRSALLAERDRILNALQDLEFDHALGKIPVEDYPTYRAALLADGAETLRKLDAMAPGVGVAQSSAEDRLEAAIAARRADARVGVAVPAVASVAAEAGNNGRRRLPMESGDEVDALIAERRRARQEKAAGFCSHCGKPVLKSDKFCPRCGAVVED